MTTPFDYDQDPERFRLGTRVTQQNLTATSLYDHLAKMLVTAAAAQVVTPMTLTRRGAVIRARK
jgi:hypothetical protein